MRWKRWVNQKIQAVRRTSSLAAVCHQAKSGVRQTQSPMLIVRMLSFPLVRLEPADRWADAAAATKSNKQIRRGMDELTVKKDKLKPELRELKAERMEQAPKEFDSAKGKKMMDNVWIRRHRKQQGRVVPAALWRRSHQDHRPWSERR